MNALIKVDRWVIKAEEVLSQLLLAAIIVFVFIAAFLRVIRQPLVWSVDLAQLLFIWVCFIGADLAMLHDKHIGVDLVTGLLPKGVQKALKIVSYVLGIVFLGLLAFYGTKLAIINVKDQFSGMEMSHSWATASLPVGCVLLIRTMVKKIYGLVARTEAVKEVAV